MAEVIRRNGQVNGPISAFLKHVILSPVSEFVVGISRDFDLLEQIMGWETDNYFGERIFVTPRAMHSLACPPPQHHTGNPEKPGRFAEDQIFERVISSSPHCASLLMRAGVRIERIRFWPTYPNDAGYPCLSLMKDLFKDTETSRIVKEHKFLDEYLLYRSILERSLVTNRFTFATRLLANTFDGKWAIPGVTKIDDNTRKLLIDSMINQDLDSYTQISKDDIFELVLELDNANKIRIKPFGLAGKVVTYDEKQISDDSFTYANNIIIPEIKSSQVLNYDILGELEDLINSQSVEEPDFQRFFDEYPSLLTGLQYAKAYPHLVLQQPNSYDLIPDYFLMPYDSCYLDILDLKRPDKKVVTKSRGGRRIRFTQYVREAVAQLLEYKRFFKDRDNRNFFYKRYKLRVYEPKMIIVVGRDSHFSSKQEIVNLNEELPNDLEILTYNTIIERTRRYLEMVDHYNKPGITKSNPS